VRVDSLTGSFRGDIVTRHSHIAQLRHPRRSERQTLNVAGRLTWRDARGIPRFATVVTRDVSADGVYLECRGGEPIPLYRLVYLQIERDERQVDVLPPALKDGRVLSAVYRVGPCEPATGMPSGYALRLLVDPRAMDMTASAERTDARSIA
jgi:hypothetical protein